MELVPLFFRLVNNVQSELPLHRQSLEHVVGVKIVSSSNAWLAYVKALRRRIRAVSEFFIDHYILTTHRN